MKLPHMFVVASTLVLCCPPAFADGYPKRKAGLWEMKMVRASRAGATQTMQQCVDSLTDEKLLDAGKGMSGGMGLKCDKQDFHQSGDSYVAETSCVMGSTKINSKTIFTGDFNSTYHSETASTYNPPLMGMAETKVSVDATFKGPCAPDQKPGDTIMANGMKVNILDVANRFAGGAVPKGVR